MKSESRIFNTLRRAAPALLLTLAYASVAHAQLAPVLDVSTATCTPPTNTVYRIEAGQTPPTTAANPYIRASSLATWSFAIVGTDTCAVVSATARTCAGISLTLPGGNANQTPDFTGPAVTTSGERVRVTATHSGNSCSADFTFLTVPGGGGWGEPDGGSDVGGQGGGMGTAGAGGEDMTTGAGGEGMTTSAGGEDMTTNAGRNGGGTAGVGGGPAGGAVSSDAAGQHATDIAGDAGASDAGAPSDASAADTTGCGCAVPAGTSGGVQAWFVLGVSVALRSLRPRGSSMWRGRKNCTRRKEG